MLFSACGWMSLGWECVRCAIYASCHATFPMPTIRPATRHMMNCCCHCYFSIHNLSYFHLPVPVFPTTTGPGSYPVGPKEYCRSPIFMWGKIQFGTIQVACIEMRPSKYIIFIDSTQAHLKFIVTEQVTTAKGTKVTNGHTNTDIFHQQSQQTQQIPESMRKKVKRRFRCLPHFPS